MTTMNINNSNYVRISTTVNDEYVTVRYDPEPEDDHTIVFLGFECQFRNGKTFLSRGDVLVLRDALNDVLRKDEGSS